MDRNRSHTWLCKPGGFCGYDIKGLIPGHALWCKTSFETFTWSVTTVFFCWLTLCSNPYEFLGAINPLTPVPPVTSHDEPWPFFHFWHHHFWPKLTSSVFNSNDALIRVIGLMEPEIGTKMLKKMGEKLRAKFPATTLGCSMVKIGHLDGAFLEVFLTASKPSRRSIVAAKRKENEKKEREKNSKILTSSHAWARMSQKAILVDRRASCCVANGFSTRLKLIWPRFSLKTTKNAVLTKRCGGQWVNTKCFLPQKKSVIRPGVVTIIDTLKIGNGEV